MTPVRAGSQKEVLAWQGVHGMARHARHGGRKSEETNNPRSSKDRQNAPRTPVRAGSQKEIMAWHDMEDGRNPRSSKDCQNVPTTPVRAGSRKKPRRKNCMAYTACGAMLAKRKPDEGEKAKQQPMVPSSARWRNPWDETKQSIEREAC